MFLIKWNTYNDLSNWLYVVNLPSHASCKVS